MLVGSLGLPLHTLATFALYIAGYSLQTVDTSKEILFKDGLRALFRQAGLEGRPVSIILNVSRYLQLKNDTFSHSATRGKYSQLFNFLVC